MVTSQFRKFWRITSLCHVWAELVSSVSGTFGIAIRILLNKNVDVEFRGHDCIFSLFVSREKRFEDLEIEGEMV